MSNSKETSGLAETKKTSEYQEIRQGAYLCYQNA